MGKSKVLKVIDLLLDNGFLQVAGLMNSSKGSKHRIYRVVHPEMINTIRAVLPMLPALPSVMAKHLDNRKYVAPDNSHEF